MANIIDLLKGIKNKIGSNNVTVEPIQMAENGGLDMQATMELAQRQPKTPFERLFGRNIEIDTDTTNPATGEITTERVAKFQPGLFNDLVSGAKENYTQGFSPYNLQDNIGTEGQNKGLAYKIGEGAGTLGRTLNRGANAFGKGLRKVGQFAETPLGRSIIVGGLVLGSGGGALPALAYGGMTGVGNQQNRMKDRAYRDSLINSAQQSRMGQPDWINLSPEQKQAELNNIANQINSYRGYIGDDTYKNMVNSQIAQEQAAYRRMYYDSLSRQNENNANLANQKFEYEKTQDAIKNAQKWTEINNENNKPVKFSDVSSLRKEFTGLAPVKNATEINRQYNNVYSLYSQYIAGKIGKNAFDQALITTLNKVLDPTSVVRESEFDRTAAGQAIWDKLAGYQQKLSKGGSGLTDENRADLVNALTIMKQANDNELKRVTQDYTDLAIRNNINPADIMPRHYMPSNNTSGETIQVGKYKVRVR